jgi:hypothetical protein
MGEWHPKLLTILLAAYFPNKIVGIRAGGFIDFMVLPVYTDLVFNI